MSSHRFVVEIKVTMILLVLALVIAGVKSNITSKPKTGDCLCATVAVHGRQSGTLSSQVLLTLSTGSCATFYGGIVVKDGYTWYEVKYNDQRVWVAGKFLVASPPSSCGGSSSSESGCPKIISRSQWGARSPTSKAYLDRSRVHYAYIHHSATAECSDRSSCISKVKSFQNYHMDTKGWNDIGYSFIIGGDGQVYEGRGWDLVGAHTKGHNDVGLGFCFIGNFMSKSPPEIQIKAVKQLIACGVSKGKLNSNYVLKGHRDVVSTSCPGDRLYSIIKGWPHYG